MGDSLYTAEIPATNTSSKGTSRTATPFLSAKRTTFRVLSLICFAHQWSNVDIGSAATLSHSIAYGYFGDVSGNFCMKVNRSIRMPDSRRAWSIAPGSSTDSY